MSKPEQSEGDRSRDQLLAGEYVLGVLPHAERRNVEARMREDRQFAAMVANWQENLSSFDGDYGEEMPPSKAFSRIEARLFSAKAARQPVRLPGRMWNSLALWRGLTLASLALLAVYASFQSGWIGELPSSQTLVAQLSGDAANPVGMMARYDSGNGQLQLLPVAARAADAHSLQLWLVPDNGGAPVSLGVLPQTGESSVRIPVGLRPRLKNGVTLAVSVEPVGGSPTGQPTGPVVASGKAQGI
ncbi:anti-sigma factor [Neorhizobium sp. NCHU2750]|uniref:anti-sigma factor n=1 Tax=Neorhizobium sp. NCHU2750 TaxID=1825976 RepID=UPI000E71DF5F|nr:anti-sigma factor, RskA family protein [Neorhizobium sp. NCHU2750]